MLLRTWTQRTAGFSTYHTTETQNPTEAQRVQLFSVFLWYRWVAFRTPALLFLRRLTLAGLHARVEGQ